jgi:hypothetical protein
MPNKLFVPIDVETPQEKLAERLAELLCERGVDGGGALILATEILVGVQAAVDTGEVTAAIAKWDERQREVEAWEQARAATEKFRTRWRRWLGNKTRANKEDWVTLLDSN